MQTGLMKKVFFEFSGFALLAAALCLTSLYSYLLFHSAVELLTVAVAFNLLMLAWFSRGFQTGGYLAFLGTSLGFIALLDLVHTLAFKGMNIFAGWSTNLPTQLWIAARWLEALAILGAPLLAKRKLDTRLILLLWPVVISTVLVLIFTGNFPVCWEEGKGLTVFKITSEYAISAVLLAGLVLFRRKSSLFDPLVSRFIILAIVLTIGSELCFTLYLSTYDLANMAGHVFKFAAFWFFFRALVITGMTRPWQLIFHDLSLAREGLETARSGLEEKVRQRTEELQANEEKFRTLFECANDAVLVHSVDSQGMPSNFLMANEMACQKLGYTREELAGLSPQEIDDHAYLDQIPRIMAELEKEGHVIFETAQVARDGQRIPVEVSSRLLDVQGTRLVFSIVHDLTRLKEDERQIRSALAEKEILLRELYHRTKNNMGVLISLLELQAGYSDDQNLRDSFRDARNRIHSMALVHEKLFQARDLSRISLQDYLESLVQHLVSSHGMDNRKIKVKIEADNVFMQIDTAIPCGLMVNELVSNSLEHAFNDSRAGTIKISAAPLADRRIKVEFADDGAGWPPGFDPRKDGHMGLQTLIALAENQLKGELSFGTGAGVSCSFVFMEHPYQGLGQSS